jgi:hypothetical protein
MPTSSTHIKTTQRSHLVSATQAKKLVSSSKKYFLIFLRENQSGEESLKVKTSLEGCTKEQKNQLEELL